MRDKLKRLMLASALGFVCSAPGAVFAQDQQTPSAEPPTIPSGERPEYRKKKLPNDVFKPSEKISEDFPVPFPVDI